MFVSKYFKSNDWMRTTECDERSKKCGKQSDGQVLVLGVLKRYENLRAHSWEGGCILIFLAECRLTSHAKLTSSSHQENYPQPPPCQISSSSWLIQVIQSIDGKQPQTSSCYYVVVKFGGIIVIKYDEGELNQSKEIKDSWHVPDQARVLLNLKNKFMLAMNQQLHSVPTEAKFGSDWDLRMKRFWHWVKKGANKFYLYA